ncbi:MAG TPA: hypothetical protein VNY27_05530 [Solirubrobacteraceae bacterium]|nr:hypothetical protein [Solirubrobacteraceae bacterium]
MFHLELRQFPHSACAFNLGEAELSQIVEPWAREQWIEVGERKWSPHQARLTVLEGPHLAVQELAMGRGWRNAQHRSQDVTERVIARARASAPAAPLPAAPTSDVAIAAPALSDAELSSLLGPDPTSLLQAWRLAAKCRPELSPSESLALAESTLSALDSSPS